MSIDNAEQMSAYSVAELTLLRYKVEVLHFLQKPFTPEKLRALLKQLLPHLHIPAADLCREMKVSWNL